MLSCILLHHGLCAYKLCIVLYYCWHLHTYCNIAGHRWITSTCTSIHTHTCILVHVLVYMHTYIRVYTRVYACILVYTCVQYTMCIHGYATHVRACMRTYYSCAYIRVHVYTDMPDSYEFINLVIVLLTLLVHMCAMGEQLEQTRAHLHPLM